MFVCNVCICTPFKYISLNVMLKLHELKRKSQFCWCKNIKIIDSLNLIQTFQKELYHFIKKKKVKVTKKVTFLLEVLNFQNNNWCISFIQYVNEQSSTFFNSSIVGVLATWIALYSSGICSPHPSRMMTMSFFPCLILGCGRSFHRWALEMFTLMPWTSKFISETWTNELNPIEISPISWYTPNYKW